MDKIRNGQTLVSVVIPVYNEGSHIAGVIKSVQTHLEKLNGSFEIIIIDDCSTDNTWSELQNAATSNPHIRAIRFSRNFGKESAVCAGLENAGGEAIIIIDGDLQHPPELIPEMISIWKNKNLDIVEAVKSKRSKEAWYNRIGSQVFYSSLKFLTGFDFRGASDFKLLDRRVLNTLLNMRERNLFFRGMSTWVGYNKGKIEFEVSPRIGGKSKWSIRSLTRLAITGITSFSSLPLHLISITGLVFFVFSVILGFHTLYMKISGQAFSGFTTVILLQLIIGSILMLGLGMIGTYIAKIYDEVKGRPRYIIDQTINLGE